MAEISRENETIISAIQAVNSLRIQISFNKVNVPLHLYLHNAVRFKGNSIYLKTEKSLNSKLLAYRQTSEFLNLIYALFVKICFGSYGMIVISDNC